MPSLDGSREFHTFPILSRPLCTYLYSVLNTKSIYVFMCILMYIQYVQYIYILIYMSFHFPKNSVGYPKTPCSLYYIKQNKMLVYLYNAVQW